MPGVTVPVFVDHILTRTFGLGVWEELRAQPIWLYGLLTMFAFASIVGHAIFDIFGKPPKYKGRVLNAEDELRIRELLVQYGEQDSLGYFATRRDKRVIFAPDGTAAITYRILGGISLASADPVGSEDSWSAVIHEWLAESAANDWIPGVLAASERGVRYYQQLGLKALELGDEAVIDVREFSAASRRRVPLHQAARRLQLAGYKSRIRRHRDIPAAKLHQLCLLAVQWQGTYRARGGFSMALSRLGDPADDHCILVEAFDPAGTLQGFLSLVPWGRHGISLDLMCRNRTSQSGLNEFMIAELVAASPRLGVSRISLTFVMFRSVFEAANRVGAGPVILGYRAVLRLFSRFVQLDSLYRFTVKCDPQWRPRFACFPRVHQTPRITLMCLPAEGFLPYLGRVPTPHGQGNTVSFVHAVQEISKRPPTIRGGIDGRKVRRAIRIRLDKLNRYRAGGNEPYMTSFVTDSELAAVREQFLELPSNTRSGKSSRVAGRVVVKRDMGRLCFLVLSDFSGNIQAILDAQELGHPQLRDMVRNIDLGDLLGVQGEILKSQHGELSILVSEWVLTAKCLHPLPGKHIKAPGDKCMARLSYLDLMIRQEPRDMIRIRCCLISALRGVLAQRDFLEIETPILHRVRQEGNTRLFINPTHPSQQPIYMHNPPGLYLKRLCVAGMSRIFEFNRSFCKKGAHTPAQEFTILEAYQAYTGYLGMLDLVRELVQQAARAAYGREIVMRPGSESVIEFDISGKWQVMTVHAAVAAALQSPITIETQYDELLRACNCAGVEPPPEVSRDLLVMCAFEQLVEPATEHPTFYIDYPLNSSPLTRQHQRDSRLAERWGLVAFGVEIATASSELTDPIEQQRRLTLQSYAATAGDSEAVELDEEFLLALEYGMPPTAGLKIRLDRLLVMLTGCQESGD
jgi:lysyl-tRNA synthetase class 2